MWKYATYLVSSFSGKQNQESKPTESKLEPPSVTITIARFPADDLRPHLMTLETMPVRDGMDVYLFHVPNLRSFWDGEDAWRMRDTQRFTLKEQLYERCNGVYIVWYTGLPFEAQENRSFHFPFETSCSPRGDVFVAKLQPQEYGEHAWAAYDDVAEEFLQLPLVTRGSIQGVFGEWGQKIERWR